MWVYTISRPCLIFIGQTCISPVTKFGLIAAIISYAFNYLAGWVMDMGTIISKPAMHPWGIMWNIKISKLVPRPFLFYSSSVKGIRITSVIVSGERASALRMWRQLWRKLELERLVMVDKVQIPSAKGLMSATDDWTL